MAVEGEVWPLACEPAAEEAWPAVEDPTEPAVDAAEDADDVAPPSVCEAVEPAGPAAWDTVELAAPAAPLTAPPAGTDGALGVGTFGGVGDRVDGVDAEGVLPTGVFTDGTVAEGSDVLPDAGSATLEPGRSPTARPASVTVITATSSRNGRIR